MAYRLSCGTGILDDGFHSLKLVLSRESTIIRDYFNMRTTKAVIPLYRPSRVKPVRPVATIEVKEARIPLYDRGFLSCCNEKVIAPLNLSPPAKPCVRDIR